MTKEITFIDVGSHSGQTLLKAIQEFPDCSKYVGIDPVYSLIEQARSRLTDERVVLCCCALDALPAGTYYTIKTLYRDDTWTKLGSSLLSDKSTAKRSECQVPCFDANDYLSWIAPTGEIILKMDIEGKEYDVLDSLLDSEFLQNRVIKLYAEWHWHKTKTVSAARHWDLIERLNSIGFPVTGHSRQDEYYCGL